MDSFFFFKTERERELYMSVRDYQFDVAISEIQEYENELLLLGVPYLSSQELSYKRSICSIIISKIFDEKVRWETGFKNLWVDSPVDIVADFYDLYERFLDMAPTKVTRSIFGIAHQTAGEILDRFL